MTRKAISEITLFNPAVETLLTQDPTSAWPKNVLNHPELTAQVTLRNQLLEKLSAFFAQFSNPEVEVTSIIQDGVIPLSAVSEVYDLLARFLESDSYNKRLVLYFPFELLPSKSSGLILPPAVTRFIEVYMKSWRILLEQTDVRANFADGNILEPELAPQGQPLVRKAAHLIPILVRKGLLSAAELSQIKENADGLLYKSIADALLTIQGCSSRNNTQISAKYKWHLSMQDEVETELRKIDMRFELDLARGLPPARVAWEQRNKREVFANKYAESLSSYLLCNQSTINDLYRILAPTSSVYVRLIALRALGVLGEQLVKTNRSNAVEMWEQLRQLYPSSLDIPELQDEIISILARWSAIGITTENDIQLLGLTVPRLDAGFSPSSRLATEVREYTSTLIELTDNPEYNKLIYPVAIFFGSKFKGYAKADADLDVAVFVRPGVSEEKRQKVRSIISSAFDKGSVGGKVVEFWLAEQGDTLQVRDLKNPDAYIADSSWVHLLFAGAWLGKRAEVELIHQRLLSSFLFNKDGLIGGRDARTVCLSEIEREVLQYRLMHKGYRRFFPVTGTAYVSSEAVDPQSTFWDSGYRRLATKLFVSRILLPKLY